VVIKEKEKEKKMVSDLTDRDSTHCYPSVVRNTLEISIEKRQVEVGSHQASKEHVDGEG